MNPFDCEIKIKSFAVYPAANEGMTVYMKFFVTQANVWAEKTLSDAAGVKTGERREI